MVNQRYRKIADAYTLLIEFKIRCRLETPKRNCDSNSSTIWLTANYSAENINAPAATYRTIPGCHSSIPALYRRRTQQQTISRCRRLRQGSRNRGQGAPAGKTTSDRQVEGLLFLDIGALSVGDVIAH